MLPLRRILCPIDFSAPSLAALDAASELASHFQSELHLLHVVAIVPPLPSDLIVVGAPLASEKEQKAEAARRLDSVVPAHVAPEIKVQHHIKVGHAAPEIVQMAAALEADLLVISTHGETGWRHLAFGSVAETIVRLAHRPVLTIHSPKPH